MKNLTLCVVAIIINAFWHIQNVGFEPHCCHIGYVFNVGFVISKLWWAELDQACLGCSYDSSSNLIQLATR